MPQLSEEERSSQTGHEIDQEKGWYQKVCIKRSHSDPVANIPLRNASSWAGFNSILRWYSKSASSLLFFANRISPNNLCPRYVSSTAMESLAHLDWKKCYFGPRYRFKTDKSVKGQILILCTYFSALSRSLFLKYKKARLKHR